MAAAVGTSQTRLLMLRGNSGSGKSSVARAVRLAAGRGVAWVEQDYLRRTLLREHDVPGGLNIALIEQTVRFALDHGYHVILEGILYSGHYGEMLTGLCRAHRGQNFAYYFDLPFDETVRRHQTRPQAHEFGTE
ncbi:MAG: AAA family ATPase, partial [Deinococcus sp.]